jgi:phage head maturation protease
METEYKSAAALVEVADADKGLVKAVFSTFDVVDLHGDVTEPGAFDDGAEVFISAWNHGSWKEDIPPVGIGTIHASEKEAWVDAQFFLSDPEGRRHFDLIKEISALGRRVEWSYGFDVEEAEKGERDGKQVRILRKLHVIEVSPVTRGAGKNTRTLAVKATAGAPSADEVAAAVIAEMAKAAEQDAAERRAQEKAQRDREILRVVAACHGIDTTGADR